MQLYSFVLQIQPTYYQYDIPIHGIIISYEPWLHMQSVLDKLLYNGLFPQVQIFPNGEPITLAEMFLIQKFTSPTTEKPHMSDISYEVYMDKTIICHTLTMSFFIKILYSCMVTTCTCICTGASKNSRSSAVYIRMCRKYIVSCGQNLFWCRAFITCSISA